jgi:CelD/BcsL family acetyltransferase involved in cellulose biosynthesis
LAQLKELTPVYQISPLQDPRWEEFLARHPRSSVFHTTPWLDSLRRTYGYEPICFTTSPSSDPLQNGLVFCRVESWITGRRFVSLPFSDHCELLIDTPATVPALLAALAQECEQQKQAYVEIRPLCPPDGIQPFFSPTATYCFHALNLEPTLETLFRNFHKDSTQRKIRRAEREGLTEQVGRSESFLEKFYRLQQLTRRRHGVPPQPRSWFLNMIDCFGEALQIRLAFRGDQPIAGILTLRHKNSLVYKYGCSDAEFNNLGGTQLLFWRAIQDAKGLGLQQFDLGRSDADNEGLITFKDRWGAARSTLSYLRHAGSAQSLHGPKQAGGDWKSRLAKQVFAHAPNGLLSLAANVLYKHVG